MRLTHAALCLLIPVCALAQTPEPAPATDAPPAAEAAPAAPAVPQESCRSLTDKGMAADLKAVAAQAQKQEAAALLPLYTASQELWTKAVEVCDGRAKERAQRNLAESQKTSIVLKDQLGDGAECAASHKDAAFMQDLARSALADRRWADAAALFHKSEDMWDAAAERCTGAQKDIALKRQEQSEIDGYNAEFCAPLFDKARETTQKLRAAAAGMSREEKQAGLMDAEGLWRDAQAQCKGAAAQESARNNAQALGRERGTPFVPKPVVAAAPKPAPAPPSPAVIQASSDAKASTAAAASTAQTAAAVSAKAAAIAAAPITAPVPPPKPSQGVVATVLAALTPTSTAPQPQAQPEEFTVDGMRFKGKFVRDVDTPTYSGTGLLTWANGDVFEGTLKASKRDGRGRFTWANGNRYQGDWVDDVPTGMGVVDFANGNHYEGAVINGIPKGAGKMNYASGDRYVGGFEAGEPQGSGSYVWKSGQKFEGDWAKGKPNGHGTMVFASGDRYEGDMVDGVPNKTGTFTWTNGDRYTGEWKAGLKSGQGVFTWSTGDRWEGLYEADVQTANGTLFRKEP